MYRTILAVLMLLVFSVSSTAATFDVRDYGAVGDGKVVDTQAIQAALDACAAAGGGRVVIPPGEYLCGRVVVPSHVTVELQAGATIQGSRRPEDYGGGPAVVFYARDAERIAFQNMSVETYDPAGETNVEHGMYPIFVDIERRHEDSLVGKIRDLTFDTIDIASGAGVLIQGMPESMIENLRLRGVSFRVTKPIDYSDRKKHIGGRRTTRDERDTLFVRKPSYVTLAYVDGLSVDGLQVSMTGEALKLYERAALSGYFVNSFAVRDVARAPYDETVEVPAVVFRESGRGFVADCEEVSR
ncbi:MAG: hypothetical protein GXX96_00110 [Planctomycetaceae bacterium]|nr:hypothetical protein [Planctomycetaceae bacterium]